MRTRKPTSFYQTTVLQWGVDLGRLDGDDVETMINRQNEQVSPSENEWRLPRVSEIKDSRRLLEGTAFKLPSTRIWASTDNGQMVAITVSETVIPHRLMEETGQLVLVRQVAMKGSISLK